MDLVNNWAEDNGLWRITEAFESKGARRKMTCYEKCIPKLSFSDEEVNKRWDLFYYEYDKSGLNIVLILKAGIKTNIYYINQAYKSN